MILAHHCIFGFYGFWLPNDPRGSGSDYVASYELLRYGPATKVTTKESVAYYQHDQARRLAAKQALKHPEVFITGKQALVISQGFRQAMDEAGYRLHALAILPDHVHAVIGWHPRAIRVIVGHLRAKATKALRDQSLWDGRLLWGEHGWNVRLEWEARVASAIRYVEENPEKEGKPRQTWNLVTPFLLCQVQHDHEVARRERRGDSTKSRLGGAALRSQQNKRAREMNLERYLNSRYDPEPHPEDLK